MTTYTSPRISIWTILLLSLYLFQFQVVAGRESALLPFGEKNNDSLFHHDDPENTIKLPYPILFAGYEYKEVHIAPNGFVGFTSSLFKYIDWGKVVPEHDPPFLAPLSFESFYKGETGNTNDGIYYRKLTSRDVLQNLTWMIRDSVVGANNFTADMAGVVTWKNIRDRDHIDENNVNTTNTFQLVIVFNRDETYAIFNYDRVHPSSKSYYHAGINAGFTKGWTNAMLGDNPDLSRLPYINSGTGEGRFVFRVTHEKPERGGCNANQSHLSVSPKSAGMFGGQMIEVSGPCLQSNMTLQCGFRSKGETVVYSSATMINHMKARCAVPRLLFRGDITLEFSIDGGKTFAAQTQFHIVLPSLVRSGVETAKSNQLNVWNQRDALELGIRWSSTLLSENPYAKVEVSLIGYMETREEFHYKTLATLGSDIRNRDSQFTFKPRNHRCAKTDCDFEVGMIEVRLTDPSLVSSHLFLTSKILPIGWFVNEKHTRTLGRNWPNEMCQKMKNDRNHHATWLETLSECPCTLDQAKADFGRWIPDAGCNVHSKSNCPYHETAVHCVRGSESTPTSSGNQCCYREDGSLMYSGDTKHGSTPDKAAALGKHPFDKINHVPELSHWVWDVIPFYYCCLWGSQCDTYMNERPTANCKNYKLPTTVTIFGDPHIITSDGFSYTMESTGVYWLLKTTTVYAERIQLQGEFVVSNLVKLADKQFSKLRAISLKNTEGDIVEVRMREPYDEHVRLDVIVNGNYIRFDRKHGFQHIFRNMAIFDNNMNGRQQNLTIITDKGIGINIFQEHGTMPFIMVIPPMYKGKIGGLLGNWSDSQTTSLTFKNGTTVVLNDEVAMLEYVREWKVKEADSLFHHYLNATPDFKPSHVTTELIPHDYENVCGKDKYNDLCKHDYIVSQNKDVASVSKFTIDTYMEFSRNQKHVANCGRLNVKHAKLDHMNYTHGKTIHVVGCHSGYLLKGHSEFHCEKKGDTYEWEPHVDAKCVLRHEEISNVGLIIAVVIGSVIAIFIITVVVCCIRNKMKSDPTTKPIKVRAGADQAEAENMITMRDTKAV